MSREQRLTLVAAILGSTIVFLDTTVINVALPAIRRDLGAGLSGQQWIVEVYLLALVSLLLIGGALGDRYGRRRVFMVGLAGFGLTSLACALSRSPETLIAARGAQGLAGALLVPGSLALIAAAFTGSARGKAIGTWTAWSGISTVIGPAGGGALVEAFTWQWIFWINVPLVAVTLGMTLRGISESRDPDASGKLDFAGVGLSALALGGIVFGLIEQPGRGWGDPVVLVPIATGIASAIAFLLRERTAANPMLDLGMFRIRAFTVANLETLAVYGGLTASIFFIVIYLQQVAGYSALEAGLAMTPVSVILFLLSSYFGRIAATIGPRWPMTLGPLVAGTGMLLLSGLGPSANYIPEVLPGAVLFGLGLSATVAPLTTTVLNAVSEGKVGTASGVSNAFARVAGLIAIAVIGVGATSQFTTTFDSQADRLPATPAVQDAAADARATTFTTGSPPQELSAETRSTIRSAATEASTEALRVAMLLCAVLMFIAAATAAVGLRRQ